MNDGMFVMLENASLANSGGLLIIVNGFNKKPNRLGQDLFNSLVKCQDDMFMGYCADY